MERRVEQRSGYTTRRNERNHRAAELIISANCGYELRAMSRVRFTANLARQTIAPECRIAGEAVAAALACVFVDGECSP